MRPGLRGVALGASLFGGLLGACPRDGNLRASLPMSGDASERPRLEALAAQAELSRAPSPALRLLLGSRSADVRARAALGLGRIGDGEAVPALGELLAQDGPDGANAAWALGRIRPARRAAPSSPGASGAGERASAAVDPAAASADPAPVAERLLRGCLRARCPQALAAARALGAQPREPESLAALAAALAGEGALAERAADALGILARLGGKGADAKVAAAAGDALWLALAGPEPAARRGAAYALGRLPRASAQTGALEGPRAAALVAALRAPDPDTRALAARAAGKQGLPAQDFAGLLTDPDWRVRVEAARALALAPGGPALLGPAIAAASAQLAGQREVAGARWAHPLTELFASAAQAKLRREDLPAPETLSGPTAAATMAARCAAAEARDRLAGALLETGTCGSGLEPDWRGRLRSATLAGELAGDHPESPPGKSLLEALADTDPRVRSAAAGSASPAFAAQLLERLDDPDPYVVASAAGALAKDPAIARAALPDAARAIRRFAAAKELGTGDPRADALAALAQLCAAALAPLSDAAAPAAPAAPARPLSPELLALRPLLSLDGSVVSTPLYQALAELQPLLFPEVAPDLALGPPAPTVPPAALRGVPGHGPRPRWLVLTTTAGELRVRLFTADGETPLTSAALAALANQGFYDGLLFHRVVPDFVAQGGDPLGDGEGGPGWALPDEDTRLPFLRGSLGIATSGPETGGSQLFLCHTPEPHLDGRYTVAGQLEAGDDALDALNVGDVILRARAE